MIYVKTPSLLLIICTLSILFASIHAQKLSGTYAPDGSCVSSDTCCCSTGEFTVSTSDDQTAVNVSGPVDGGKGCQNIKTLSAAFTVVDQYTATWVVPVYNMKYVAKSSSDYASISVSRQDITDNNCINKMVKKSGGMTSGNGSSGSSSGSSSSGSSSSPGSGTSIGVVPRPNTSTGATNTANPNGSFKATATPDVILNQGVGEGTFSIDSSYTIRYGILATQAGNNFYDLWFILEPTSTLFSNSLAGNSVTIHFISPTTSDPSTATSGSPVNAQMAVQDGSGQSRQWKYTNIRVPPGSGLRFSFTYTLQGAVTDFKDTPTVFFQATGTSTSYVTVTPGGGSTTTTTTTNNNDPWTGTFNVDTSRCTQSNDCCCALGQIIAKSGTAGTVNIKSTLDGSNTCGNMKEVSGDFTIDQTATSSASYKHPEYPLTLTAELSADGNTISFKNSMYSCLSYGNRAVSSTPTSTSNTGSTNTNTNTGGNTGAAITHRDQVIGEWESNGQCKPTISCCCLQGKMRIETLQSAMARGVQIDTTQYDLNNANLMYGSGALDGGTACFKKSTMEGVCDINMTTMSGSCLMQGITFNAKIQNGNQLLITNSMYKDCDSVAIKVTNADDGSSSGNSVPFTIAQAVGFFSTLLVLTLAL